MLNKTPEGQADERAIASGDGTKIYVDLTTTYHLTGNPTGIARVEQRAFQALLDQYKERIVPVTWVSSKGKYLKLRPNDTIYHPTIRDVTSLYDAGEIEGLSEATIQPGSNIVVFGGAWIRNKRYINDLVRLKKSTDLRLTILVHDLIQMKFSYLYPPGAGDEFTANARRIVALADNFLCYSKSSRNDLEALMRAEAVIPKPISLFKIGDMTDGIKSPSSLVDGSAITQSFNGKKFFLFVSSIDPRKNHILLLNVWRRLIEMRGSSAPHLVLVGRPIWKAEDVLAIGEGDKTLSSHVHFLTDVCDADLHWFYSNCVLTLYPSIYEGWGLPVSESLAYGKLCITANTSATAEIAPNLTDLLHPHDFKAWLDRVCHYLDDPEELARRERRIRRSYKRHPWDQSVRQIVSAIDPLPRVVRGHDVPIVEADPPKKAPEPKPLSENLQIALAQTQPPSRLPRTRRLFRILRFLRLDRVIIKIHRQLTWQTNDSIRRVIEEIHRMQQK